MLKLYLIKGRSLIRQGKHRLFIFRPMIKGKDKKYLSTKEAMIKYGLNGERALNRIVAQIIN